MYWGYETDNWFWDYESNLAKNRIFPRSYADKSLWEIVDIYQTGLQKDLWDNYEEVLSLSEQINTVNARNSYDVLITVPSFYKEKSICTTIEEIQKQASQNLHVSMLLLVYNNGYGYWSELSSSIQKAETTISQSLQEACTTNLDTLVISKVYPDNPWISLVRSDIFDALLLSTISQKIHEKSIYLPFDADLRKIENGYVTELLRQHDMWYKIVIWNRNRSFEEEKNIDPFLYLQEKIFLLWEEAIYNTSDDIEISTITNWRSSSFDLRSLLLTKWYERHFDAADDLIVWHKLNRFYWKEKKNKNITAFIEKNIWSDWSRWSDMLQQWKLLFEQWDRDSYAIKNDRNTKKDFYNAQNFIIRSLCEWKPISEKDIIWIERMFKSYIDYFHWKNQYLNLKFKENLIVLLKNFFWSLCIYDFSYSDIQDEIKIHLS